jgi:aerobic C4-dicarboxylate transport protein
VLGTSSSESALPSLMENLNGSAAPSRWWAWWCRPDIRSISTAPISYDAGNPVHCAGPRFRSDHGPADNYLACRDADFEGSVGHYRGGLYHLAATLAVVDPRLVPGMAIVLGIDKFMSEVRALTNLCGNGVACVVVAWWEGELDRAALNKNLGKQIDPADLETALTTG